MGGLLDWIGTNVCFSPPRGQKKKKDEKKKMQGIKKHTNKLITQVQRSFLGIKFYHFSPFRHS
jgi:hypothetical protein